VVLNDTPLDDEWKEHSVKGDEDLANVKPIMKAAMEKRAK
jgi:hypothetical protein